MRGIIKLKEKEIPSSGYFKYLGSIFQRSVHPTRVTHRIKCGRQKWKYGILYGILSDRDLTTIRLALLYKLLYESVC